MELPGSLVFYQSVFPNIRLIGQEQIPDEPCVIAGKHNQIYIPLASELRLDFPQKTWCAGEMMRRDEAASCAFQDLWSFKPRWSRPFNRLPSHLIPPLALCLFNAAHTIPVYRDVHLRNTLRLSPDILKGGERLGIFPNKNETCNHHAGGL